MRDVSIASDLNILLEYRHLELKYYAVQESFKLAIKLRTWQNSPSLRDNPLPR